MSKGDDSDGCGCCLLVIIVILVILAMNKGYINLSFDISSKNIITSETKDGAKDTGTKCALETKEKPTELTELKDLFEISPIASKE